MADRRDMAEKSHVESVSASNHSDDDLASPDLEKPTKRTPLVYIQAHENAEHVDLGWRSWVILLLTALAIAAQVFAVTAPVSVMAFIIRDVGNRALAGWILQGPLLMQSILSPVIGRLSDVLDRRYMVGVLPLIAVAGAIVSAKSTSMSMLIGGGFLIGLTLPSAAIIHAIQAEILPLKYRTVGSSIAFIGSAIGGYFGGLAAGAVTNTGPSGWRIIFWIQVGLHALTSIGFLAFYWPKRRSNYSARTLRQYIWMCDPIGSFFYMTGTTCIILALNWSGGAYPWRDAHVAAPLSIGLVLFLLFCLYEWKGRTDGLVPHVFFESGPNFPVAVFAFSIDGWVLYSALMTIVPQTILNLGFEDNAWHVAVRKLAYGTSALVFCVLISFWSTYFKDLKRPLFLSFGLLIITTCCFATLNPTQSKLQIVYSVISGISQAGPLSLLVPIIQFAAPHEYLSTASGIAYSGRSIGGAFGSAVLNAISNGYIHAHYRTEVSESAVKAGLPSTSASKLIRALRSRTPVISATRVPGISTTSLSAAMETSHWVYSRAYQLAWWSILPFAVIAFISVFFIRDVKDLMTEKVEATVENVPKNRDEKV